MRVLLACPGCHRSYDATGMPLGGQFHCRCGEVLRVQAPQGHEAAVVRCSSCGGPRQQGAQRCSYCGADFTLHAQQLDTVCPHCLALVPHQARFCHSCGSPLVVDEKLGSPSPWHCPVCGPQAMLLSRSLGQKKVSVLECQRCAGMWLSHQALEHLVEQAAQEAHPVPPETVKPVASPAQPQPGPRYRRCVECGQIMVRRNYGRRSGVIVDVCGRHGVWFDCEELHKVLRWIRSGGRAQPLLNFPDSAPAPTSQGPDDRSWTLGTWLDVFRVLFE